MILAAAIGAAFGLGYGLAGFPARFLDTVGKLVQSAHEGGQ